MAQSIEIYAGAPHFQDSQATLVAIQPQSLAFGPDGKLYILGLGGELYRYDPAAQTLNSLPGLPGEVDFKFYGSNGMASDAAGKLYLATQTLYYMDPSQPLRQAQDLGTFGTTQEVAAMAAGSDGSIAWPLPDSNRVKGRFNGGFTFAIAGNGTAGFGGDGFPATSAWLNHPMGVVIDAAGNYYIADTGNQRIRKVDGRTFVISTIAGTGDTSFNGDNLPALSTNLCMPATPRPRC